MGTRSVSLLLVLLLSLAVAACETSRDETTDAAVDPGARDALDDADGPRETTPLTDVCCGPDDVAPPDGSDASDTADVPSDPGSPDVPHPMGCCETPGDCGEGAVCLGLDFGTPGTCWPAPHDGECFFDSDCAADEACLGEKQTICVMSSLPIEGACVKGPLDCCLADPDCAAFGDHVCAAADGPDDPGICMPRPTEGRCWTTLQCGPYEHCEGAAACGCRVDCDGLVQPGYCEPDQPNECCHTNDDCPHNAYCVAGHLGEGGVCTTGLLPDGSCFVDADCGGEALVCDGEQLCSCDMNCVSHSGMCVGWWSDCCFVDADCAPGALCAGADGPGSPGVCKLPAPEGTCWDDAECPPFHACEGAAICPCDADCDMIDTPGSCQPVSSCCGLDEDCPSGYECVWQVYGLADELPGACKPVQPAGMCWDDTGCATNEWCVGATPCPCDWSGVGDGCDIPGTCTSLPAGCCQADADCAEGLVCRAISDLPGSCVPDPAGPDCQGDVACCWDDTDCTGGTTCHGVSVCGCIELCFTCGACAEDQLGACL